MLKSAIDIPKSAMLGGAFIFSKFLLTLVHTKNPCMKIIRESFFLLIILFFGCRTASDSNQVLEDLQENIDFGNINTVTQIVDSLKKVRGEDKEILHIADSLSQIAERIRLDFSVTEGQVKDQIEKLIGSVSSNERSEWENNGWLEWRMIDGKKKYFNRAASNLAILKKFHEQKEERLKEIADKPSMILRLKHTGKVIKASGNRNIPVEPVKMKITYSISVHPDAVPDGEKIRCWMPWPKEGLPRQNGVELLSTSKPEYTIAPDSSIHSTIYMEGIAKKGTPTEFKISFNYTSYAQHFNMKEIKILPYNKDTYEYLKYTSEQLPHICFTDNVRRLADSITQGDDNTTSIVRKIYFWFKESIPWTGALEYSTITNIPEYVIKNMRGDCGEQVFLFISMLRYKGIPVRWQSGWEMTPDDQDLHDWTEVYYEGTGWVPVDVMYDLQKSDNETLKDYFLSGIDAYRLIVNIGVEGPLHPQKKFLRSEPYDFQRGEVEWKGANLYFDKWDYNMEVEYLK